MLKYSSSFYVYSSILFYMFLVHAKGNQILLPLLQESSDKSVYMAAHRVCQVADSSERKFNIIYSGWTQNDSMAEALEQHLHRCISHLPHYHINSRQHKQELVRIQNSLSIFVMETGGNCIYLLHILAQFLNANQRNKYKHWYIFVLVGQPSCTSEHFFHLLWSKHIVKAIVLYSHNVSMYTYEPYSATGWRVLKLKNEGPYFYEKLFNLYGNQLRITMFEDTLRAIPLPSCSTAGYTAVDGELARTIVQKLNATALYVAPADNDNFGVVHENGTITGALKDISTGFTHIRLNVGFTPDDAKEFVEELYPHKWRGIFLVVPAASLLPEYVCFTNVFNAFVWLCWIFIFLLFLSIFFLIQYMTFKLSSAGVTDQTLSVLSIVQLLLRTHMGKPFKEGILVHAALRVILLSWIIFSYIWTSVYFAKLESNFVHPAYENEIDKLNEIFRLHVPIYGTVNLIESSKLTLHPDYWKHISTLLHELPQNLAYYDYYMEYIKNNPNVAFILNGEHSSNLFARTINHNNNRASFNILKDYLRLLPNTYIVPLGSAFLNVFQKLVIRVTEHGLMDHWLTMDYHRRSYESSIIDQNYYQQIRVLKGNKYNVLLEHSSTSNDIQRVVLSLGKLQAAFYIWLLGIVLSVICFIAEYFYYTRKLKKNSHIM